MTMILVITKETSYVVFKIDKRVTKDFNSLQRAIFNKNFHKSMSVWEHAYIYYLLKEG